MGIDKLNEDTHSCCSHSGGLGIDGGVHQSLTEMEFERGIWFAAQHNDINRIEYLLKKEILADAQDSAGYTALHYAARSGHVEACRLLLRNGADVNARTKSLRATPLHRASMQGHTDIVELLINSGAMVNLTDADGCTALHRAIEARTIEVCKRLIPLTDREIKNKAGYDVYALTKEKFPELIDFFKIETKID